MGGSYFLPLLLVALIVPLMLSSIGPTQSHPELGTDMAPEKRKKIEVYRSNDVQTDAAIREYQKRREVVKLQAYRRGHKVHLKRRDE
jgi:Ni/Co efflux regulator RcnB